MTPFVRLNERALEGQEIADHERLEQIRIGHPLDAGAAEIPVEQRALRASDGDHPSTTYVPIGADESRR